MSKGKINIIYHDSYHNHGFLVRLNNGDYDYFDIPDGHISEIVAFIYCEVIRGYYE